MPGLSESDLFWNHLGVIGRRLDRHFDPQSAFAWLLKPHADLNGRTPIHLVAEGKTEKVLALIDRMDEGG